MVKPKIGFVGLGWIGGNYADDFEERGYEVVRYSKSKFAENKERIAECPIVFIAVPTPSTPEGFDISAVRDVLSIIGKGSTAVIKSTIQVGTVRKLQADFPDITVMHSPEFLTEATAAHDARHPDRNIIGCTDPKDPAIFERAVAVMQTLPIAPFQRIVRAEEAEMVKYAGNIWFVFKVLFINTLFDLERCLKVDTDVVRDLMSGDPRIGYTHLDPVHKGGRGAGGHCFIKDFAAYIEMYAKSCPIDDCPRDMYAIEALYKLEDYNIYLLNESKKNLDLLKSVYGKRVPDGQCESPDKCLPPV